VIVTKLLERTAVTEDRQLFGFGRVVVEPADMVWLDVKPTRPYNNGIRTKVRS
jgi:hypothetical protein